MNNNSTLQTVVEALSLCLSAQTLSELKASTEEELCLFHFGLGIWLRNNLLLPGSVLFQSFKDNGIDHADDMSGMIIRELWEILKK